MKPIAFERITEGGQVLLWGIRHWMVATLHELDVPASVLRTFEAIGGRGLYPLVADFLLIAARDGDRPLVIHPPCSSELSRDEEHIVRVIAASSVSAESAPAQARALIGREPSAGLIRRAFAIALWFRAAALDVRVADVADPIAGACRSASWLPQGASPNARRED